MYTTQPTRQANMRTVNTFRIVTPRKHTVVSYKTIVNDIPTYVNIHDKQDSWPVSECELQLDHSTLLESNSLEEEHA